MDRRLLSTCTVDFIPCKDNNDNYGRPSIVAVIDYEKDGEQNGGFVEVTLTGDDARWLYSRIIDAVTTSRQKIEYSKI